MKSGTGRFCEWCCRISLAGALVALPLFTLPVHAAKNTLTDQAITDEVENEFDYDPAIWSQKIDIVTNKGIVTLNGVIDNILERDRAAKVARTVKGVRAVVNNIVVRPLALKSAEGLKNDVFQSLAVDPATQAYKISVDADNAGRVTLKGTVDSWQEKQLAEIVAKGTVGVTSVDNRLRVNPEEERALSPHEIREEVKHRLFWDVLVDSRLIKVSVTGHRVTLTGTVGSASEKKRAGYLAQVAGVSHVDTSGLEVQDWAKDPNRRNPNYAVKSDDEIEAAVRDALRYDPRVSPFAVKVDAQEGEVTLRGNVSNLAAKRRAEQDARNTVGVSRVTNRIKVRAIENVPDDELAMRVKAAFRRDPYIDAYKISVVVNHQVAKLYGTVDTYFDKAQADFVADRVNGLTGVVNHLKVRQTNRPLTYDPYVNNYPPYMYGWYDYRPVPTYRSDRQIRQDIKDQLWWSPFVDSDHIAVKVVHGTATLTGYVDSWSAWRAATENAWQGGATWVVNDLGVRNTSHG